MSLSLTGKARGGIYLLHIVGVHNCGLVEHGGPLLRVGDVPKRQYAVSWHQGIPQIARKPDYFVVRDGPRLHLLILGELVLHDVSGKARSEGTS